jgi:hypothetical protein
MKQLFYLILALSLLTPVAQAKEQVLISGDSAEKVQENAFRKRMNYPVGPLKCNQYCSQWWEKN